MAIFNVFINSYNHIVSSLNFMEGKKHLQLTHHLKHIRFLMEIILKILFHYCKGLEKSL